MPFARATHSLVPQSAPVRMPNRAQVERARRFASTGSPLAERSRQLPMDETNPSLADPMPVVAVVFRSAFLPLQDSQRYRMLHVVGPSKGAAELLLHDYELKS